MIEKKAGFKKPLLIYTVFFFTVGFFVFFWFLLYGKSVLSTGDGFAQCYPILLDFQRKIGDLIAGKGFSFWSWEIGLGGDTIGTLYFFLTDPLFYIAALFPPEQADIGCGLATYLHLYFAGIAMMVFLHIQNHCTYKLVIGGLGYTFSLWTLTAILQEFFLIPLILFPLMLAGIEKLDREGRPYLLIISVALSLITSAYFSYMSALMLAIYSVVSFFFLPGEKNVRRFCLRILRFAGCVIVAVCIAAPLMFPYLWAVLRTSKESSASVTLLPLPGNALQFFPALITGRQMFGNYSAISTGGVFAALIPAFVIDFRQKRNRLPVSMFALNMLFLFFPVVCSVFNGFSYPTGRWCYMLAFFYIWAGISVLDLEKFQRTDYRAQYKWGLGILFGLFSVSLVISGCFFNVLTVPSLSVAIINLAFVCCTGWILLSGKSGKKASHLARTERLLLLLTAVNIACVYLVHHYPLYGSTLDNYTDIGQSYRQYSDSTQRSIASLQKEDRSFYRSDQGNFITLNSYTTVFHFPANESIMYGVRSVTTYMSSLDADTADFYKAVCNNQNYIVRVIEFGNDNRSRLNYLTGVKYFTAKNDQGAAYASYGFAPWSTDGDIQILKSKFEPSLGYVYSRVISDSRFEEYSYLDREQILMQAAVVDDDYKGIAAEADAQQLQLHTEEVPCEFLPGNGLTIEDGTITVSSANATLTLKPSLIENSEVYVFFKNFTREPLTYEAKQEQTLGDDPTRLQRDRFALNNLSYQPYANFELAISAGNIQKRLLNSDGSNQATIGIVDYMSNLGYCETWDEDIVIRFPIAGTYHFDSIQVLAVSQQDFDEQARALEANRLQVTTLRDNYVKGTVDSDGGLLYLSIPDNGGWNVWIDGEKTEKIYRVDIGFIGVDVPAGAHTVELRYRPFGFHATLAMFAVGCVSFAGIVVFHRIKKKKTMFKSSEEGKV